MKLNDSFDIIKLFEKYICEYTGSPYAIAIDSCTNGIFLCLKYLNNPKTIEIPCNTYISVPMQIYHANYNFVFNEEKWSGIYNLKGTNIWDCAQRFTKNMYISNTLQVLSFQHKKTLNIGKGGAILTDNEKTYKYLRKLSFDGRNLNNSWKDLSKIDVLGYHMNFTPEQAAQGLIKFSELSIHNKDNGSYKDYPDLRKFEIFNKGE